jgi:hypothetical protein
LAQSVPVKSKDRHWNLPQGPALEVHLMALPAMMQVLQTQRLS